MNGNRSNRSLFRQLLTVASSLSISIASFIAAPSTSLTPALASQPNTTASQIHPNSIDLWPGSCNAAVWTPSEGALSIRAINNQIAVSVSADSDLTAGTSQFQIIQPGQAASAWQPVSSVSVVTSKSLILYVTNPVITPANNDKVVTTIQFRVTPSNGIGYVCSKTYTVWSKTVYMPYLLRSPSTPNITDLTTSTEPDNNICLASYTLSPNQNYVAQLSDTNDLYKVVVTEKSNLNFTVSGFTQEGQIQLRAENGLGCAGVNITNTGTLYNNSFQAVAGDTRTLTISSVNPGTYYFRVVLTGNKDIPNSYYQFSYSTTTPSSSPYEPNNTPCTAAAISAGTEVGAFADDDNDWYLLTTAIRTNIQITATNPVTKLQYLIYYSATNDCAAITSNTQLLTWTGGTLKPILNVTGATAGKYFLRIAPTDGYRSSTDAYVFRATATSALATQGLQTQSASQPPKNQAPAPFDLSAEPTPVP